MSPCYILLRLCVKEVEMFKLSELRLDRVSECEGSCSNLLLAECSGGCKWMCAAGCRIMEANQE